MQQLILIPVFYYRSYLRMKITNTEILLEIKNVEKLRRLKALDSIHISTANIFNKLIDNKLMLYSYDISMINIAKELEMEAIC